MAEPEVTVAESTDDVDMGETVENVDALEGEVDDTAALPETEPEIPVRTTFLDYLRSPIVQLSVGSGTDQTLLSAHEALLTQSPFFAGRCASFANDVPRLIELPDEDLEATGSLLEYLYHGEYFPKRLGGGKDMALENDPSIPSPDDTGASLLRHAKVYTLADKFGLPALKSLAHSKIHRTSSTAKGEIAYAKFVYKETSADDHTLRKPVAAFWATRSHVLRHEAEVEFRQMCLEYPQFGFDVLNLVLDQKERREPTVQPGSSRKRARNGLAM
ncbi:hypothetical protein EJ05DRAFT_472064 [Pseudovirgaria hyperparasitica]|uniref:BTB domain-containing protein n=1 Tax=Pseudovirgaria hyperparasitica TaxID=470096 RepID=A0A6A6WLU5_9PEZI|nr:uncharacterized protein EJ05DRAFT_472064 [Pseudovirgaria hyperparasitica]KAF2763132.1 hypothetical protein EJ05DRAFT_472064 [Pseudovirgaria hyperparasitica]